MFATAWFMIQEPKGMRNDISTSTLSPSISTQEYSLEVGRFYQIYKELDNHLTCQVLPKYKISHISHSNKPASFWHYMLGRQNQGRLSPKFVQCPMALESSYVLSTHIRIEHWPKVMLFKCCLHFCCVMPSMSWV